MFTSAALSPKARWNYLLCTMIGSIGVAVALVIVGFASANDASGAERIDGERIIGAGGVFAAIAAVMAALLAQVNRDEIEQSKFYLDSALVGFRTALGFFENNNDRVRWIAGARILAHSKRLEKSITVAAHRNVYEMHREEMRDQVARILGFDNPLRTANFFRGIPDDAEGGSIEYQSVRALDHSSLAVMLEFSAFPVGYDDPTEEYRLTRQDVTRQLRYQFPALHEYLTEYFGELERRRAENARNPNQPPRL